MNGTTHAPGRGIAGAPTHDSPSAHRDTGILVVILGAVFMALLDATVVNVATPAIRGDLRTTGSALQLIVSGYTLAYAALLITGARLGARHGFRTVFLLGLTVFTLASAACGLAPGAAALIGARVVQGLGAGLMVPQIYSLIQVTFEGRARARALSLYATAIAAAVVVGQVTGGLLVSADLFGTGWRPVFLINVPVGAALLAAAARLLPREPARTARALDLPGVVTLTAALLLLVVPLVLGHERHWPRWTGACLAAAVPAAVLFVLVERAVARRGGAPLVPARVLRSPDLVWGATALFFCMSGYAGFLFAFSQHLQTGLGESAVRAGLTFAPLAVGVAAGSLTWRRLPARWHLPMIAAACALAAAGYLGLGLVLRGGGTGGPALLLLQLVWGLGLGFTTSPLLTLALSGIAPADAADASGVLTTVPQLAQVIGVAGYGSVFLTGAAGPGGRAAASAHALYATALPVAAGSLLAGLAVLPLLRRSSGIRLRTPSRRSRRRRTMARS
ncbi:MULTISPECIES: MFS transporter [unclassified Streptomyces]|uniref:MFS transporter n=1 Tax=unclassified Streptomyces TaxID=2593676 RepID=UPI001EEFCB2C|nr:MULTISPECIES: MFS transporter [unclassified Streptomyces]